MKFKVKVTFHCDADDGTLAADHVQHALGHARAFSPVPPFSELHVEQERAEVPGNNYGTLSSDYDAGYDDGLAAGFKEGLGRIRAVLDADDDWGGDTFDAIETVLKAHGVGTATNAELACAASAAYEAEHGLASMPDEVAAALDRLRSLDDDA